MDFFQQIYTKICVLNIMCSKTCFEVDSLSLQRYKVLFAEFPSSWILAALESWPEKNPDLSCYLLPAAR